MVGTKVDVALLEERRGGDAIALVRALAMAGKYRITALDVLGRSFTRYSRNCRYRRLAPWDWDDGPGQLNEAAPMAPGAVLIPTHIRTIGWMIRHRDELSRVWKLPLLPSPDSFDTAQDKLRLAQFAARHGIRVPAFAACGGGEWATPGQIAFPALLKPRAGAGGLGIEKIGTAEALEERLAELPNAADYLVQTCLEGTDLSCGAFARKGRVLAQTQYACQARYAEFYPYSSIRFIEDRAVSDFVARIVELLEWDGLINLDMRRDDAGRLHLLEINPRPFGCILAAAVGGVNLADIWCQSASGEVVAVNTAQKGNGFEYGTRAALHAVFDSLGRKDGMARLATTWRESILPFVLHDPLPHVAEYATRLTQRIFPSSVPQHPDTPRQAVAREQAAV